MDYIDYIYNTQLCLEVLIFNSLNNNIDFLYLSISNVCSVKILATFINLFYLSDNGVINFLLVLFIIIEYFNTTVINNIFEFLTNIIYISNSTDSKNIVFNNLILYDLFHNNFRDKKYTCFTNILSNYNLFDFLGNTDFYIFDFTFINSYIELSNEINDITLHIILFNAFIMLYLLINFFINKVFKSSSTRNIQVVNMKFIEVEKEITNVDDILLVFIIFILTSLWFFFLYFLPIFFNNNDFLYVVLFLPIFMVLVLSMPLYLLIDFTVVFIKNLKGSTNTTILTLEYLFDILAITIMFVRLFVQNIRFFIILLAYSEIHEYFILNVYQVNEMFLVNSFYTEVSNLTFSFKSISYFILTVLPLKIIYLLYNIMHLFFVVIAHITAFFALVFWLFFFLYTCFYYKNTQQVKQNNTSHQLDIINKFKYDTVWSI